MFPRFFWHASGRLFASFGVYEEREGYYLRFDDENICWAMHPFMPQDDKQLHNWSLEKGLKAVANGKWKEMLFV